MTRGGLGAGAGITHEDGTIEKEFDDENNTVSYKDKMGNTWLYDYDNRGNRTKETDKARYKEARKTIRREIKYPFFKKDRILKIEMLENFRDFPRDVLEVYNVDSSDGIVCGLDPSVNKDVITFSKGIVKYKGDIYVIHKPIHINYGVTETDVAINLNFLEESEDKDYRTMYVEVVLEEIKRSTGNSTIADINKAIMLKENQLELGRFKLKSGAYLRSDYQDLYDFTTEYNTINIVHAQYAGFKQPTLSHLILKYFAREALVVRPDSPLDINFCMMCLNSRQIERETILNYIGYKLEEEIKPLSNIELHGKLVFILEKIKKESGGLKRRPAAQKKIIVD